MRKPAMARPAPQSSRPDAAPRSDAHWRRLAPFAALFALTAADARAQAFDLEAARARTRGQIEDVTADRARPEDQAMSLGTTLSPNLRQRNTELPLAAPRGAAPDKARTPPPAPRAESAPPPPSAERLGTRTRSGETQARAYTPDLSRQTLTFARFAGRSTIDLPRTTGSAPAEERTAPPWALADIVRATLQRSPSLRQTQAQHESAEARTGQSVADLLPTLSTRLASGRAETRLANKPDAETDDYRTQTTRLVQPIYNHVLIKNLSGTRAAETAAAHRVEASREAVALSAIQAGANLAAQRILIDDVAQHEAQLGEVLAYLEDRAASGASSRADLERARTRVLAARELRINQQAAYQTALYELERLLGHTPDALHLPFLNQLPGLPQTQAEIRRLVLDSNADLQALRADITAQEAAVSAQYGRLLPSLALSAERDHQENTEGPSPLQKDRRLLAVLNWSVSLGGKEIHGGREASAELRNRIARYDDEKQRLEQALETDFSLLLSATQRIAAGEAEQRAAQTVVEATREQMRVGRIGSLLDALDAFDRLYAARQKLALALSQQMSAHAQLLRRLGQLAAFADGAPLSSGEH